MNKNEDIPMSSIKLAKDIETDLSVSEDTSKPQSAYPSFIHEIRLAVIGNVDSGKSTLVGCLTKNVKDDGRGYARKFVFNYPHETESGRTSSIAQELIGFKNNELVEAGRLTEKKNVSWKEILNNSDKLVSLIDLCGHEKYLKTTMYGLTALLPDYAMILIGTNMGVQRMTKEHLGIIISLNVPFFIVFTKIDIAPKEVKENTVNTFSNLLKTGLQKTVFNVKTKEDAKASADAIIGGTVVPIFQISAVTGEGLDNLKYFISNLIPRYSLNSDNYLIKTPKDKVEFLIDSTFNTKVGIIHAGVLTSGTIEEGQNLLLGPTAEGQFKPVQIRKIHFKRVEVPSIECGNECSVKLKSMDKNYDLTQDNFRKGMILVSPEGHLTPCLEFEIEALIVHHASTIKIGYQSVIHCHVVRQTASIVEMNKECMRAGDTGIIKFRFINSPEYLHLGDIVLFREGRTRGKGKIVKLYPIDDKKFASDKKAGKNLLPGTKIKNSTQNNSNNISKKESSNKGGGK